MESLLEQIKKRRLELALKQHDMLLCVGMSRQQYQRLESKGNPRLETLELIAKGLRGELMLIPQEKLNSVLAVLADDAAQANQPTGISKKLLSDDPWQGILGDNE